jgi:PAS domain S-box-containing protein
MPQGRTEVIRGGNTRSDRQRQERVLVHAPFGNDARLICQTLADSGLHVATCHSGDQLCAEIRRGAAAALLTEESLSEAQRQQLLATLAQQPTWSDFPLLILLAHGTEHQHGWHAWVGLEGAALLTLLERPLHVATLVSAVRVAVQSRRKQYQVCDELTARQRAEAELRSKERQLRAFLENSAVIAWIKDSHGRYVFLSRNYERRFGMQPADWQGRTDFEIWPPEIARQFQENDRTVLECGAPLEMLEEVSEPDGSTSWWLCNKFPLQYPDGRCYVAGMGVDVTERKRTEQALQRSEEFAHKVLSASLNGLYIYDLVQGRNVFINPSCTRLIGYTREDLDALSPEEFFALFHPDDQPRVAVHMQAIQKAADGEIMQIEYRLRTKSGQWRWYLSQDAVFARRDDGTVCQYIGSFLDVTEIKQAQRELQRSREDLNRAQEVGRIGNWRLDVRRNVLIWSDECYRIFGVPQGTALTYESFLETVHPDDRQYVNEQWSAALRGEPYDNEHRIVVRGQIRWLRQRAYLEFDREGTLLGAFGITQDITDRKQVEKALWELNETLEAQVAERAAVAERRARSLRRLAAKLSDTEQRERQRLAKVLHDGLQQLLVAAKFHLPDVDHSDTESIRSDVDTIERLLNESLSASRSLAVELSPPILQRGEVAEVFQWLSRWFQENYELLIDLQITEPLPPVSQDIRGFMFDAVRELLFNVVKHSGAMTARLLLEGRPEGLAVHVEDDGRGFDPPSLENKLEQPQYFGLFSIRERLESLGGRLEFTRTAGGGARFSLQFPLDDLDTSDAASADAGLDALRDEPAAQPRQSDGCLRLLVVDDNEIVRRGLVSLLDREADVQVVGQASDGLDAVRQARALRPDAIVMDIDMPQLNGIEATRQIIKAIQPACTIVGLSVHGEEYLARTMIEAGATACLSKAGSFSELLTAIRNG